MRFFDLLIAVALACGFLLTEVRQLSTLQWRSRLWTLSVLAIAFPFVVQAVGIAGQISGLYEESRHLAAVSRVFREDANYLRQKQGPVICESLLLCEYAGKWPAIDPFNERRLAAMKRLDESSLLNEVRDKEIGVIQYTLIPDSNQHSWTSTRFSRAFLDAVQQNYKIDRRSSISQFFVPRE